MPVLGLTGGVASGKSSFLERLRPQLKHAEVYDADAAVHRLLKTTCKEDVLRRFGRDIAGPDGLIDRARLRSIVLRNPQARRDLEGILHPEVRREWRGLVAALRESETRDAARRQAAACKWLILAIPLLYETGADAEMDVTVVVACRPETQVRRIVEKRGLDESTAKAFLAAQLPLSEKMARCRHVVWNDGPAGLLEPQAKLLAERLQSYARR